MALWVERCEELRRRGNVQRFRVFSNKLRRLLRNRRKATLRFALNRLKKVSSEAVYLSSFRHLASAFEMWKKRCQESIQIRKSFKSLFANICLQRKRQAFRLLYCEHICWKIQYNSRLAAVKRLIRRWKLHRAIRISFRVIWKRSVARAFTWWRTCARIETSKRELQMKLRRKNLLESWLRFTEAVRSNKALRKLLLRISHFRKRLLIQACFHALVRIATYRSKSRKPTHKYKYPRTPCDYVKLNYKAFSQKKSSRLQVTARKDKKTLCFHESNEVMLRNRIHDCNYLFQKLQKGDKRAIHKPNTVQKSLWGADETILTLGFERRQRNLAATKSYWV